MILSGNVPRAHGFELRLKTDHLGPSPRIEASRNAYAKICLCGFSMLSSGGTMVRHSAPPHCQGADRWLQIVKIPSDSGSHMCRG